jgi:Flp pilus assembly protein TadD
MTAQRLGNLDQLESDLRVILAMSPNNATVLNALGYTLADQTDRYEEAFELISKALELAPEEPAILDSLGWILFKLGRLEEAEHHLRHAYQQLQDPEIAAHLGEVLVNRGKTNEARQLWTAAIEASPQHQALVDTVKRLQPALLATH